MNSPEIPPTTRHGDTCHTARAGAEDDRERLDKFLAGAVPGVSRARIKALIQAGRIAAGGETITDPSYRVKPGETFVLDIPEAVAATPLGQAMDLAVVYEDGDLIVIDKPAGMVVHPAPGNPDRTLVNALIAHCGDSLSGIGGVLRPGIVHRLDKDTGGLIVAAKNDAAHAGLTRQFADRSLSRIYRAVARGVPTPRVGEIEGNIGRNPSNRKKMAVLRRGGRPAATGYRVIEAFGSAASLLECQLRTGRTHQIRVHLADRGYPVVGDPLYGRAVRRKRGTVVTAGAREAIAAFPRQALHACSMTFRHPLSGERMHFESALPGDMAALIETLARAAQEAG